MNHLTKLTAKEDVDFMRDETFKDRKSLTIAVEGKDDVDFWSFVFDRSSLRGNYKIFKSYQYPTPDASGKYTLEHFLPHTQRDFAICIDSDYDYLLENPVWQRPFVFQTYTYSIENYYCYVPSLNAVMNRAANLASDTEGSSFEDIFIRQFSENIYELLIESLQEAINDGRSEDARRKLGRHIRLTSGQNIDALLSDLDTRIQNKIQHLIIINEFKQRLLNKGLTPENAYLFVRGHDVFNSVFVPILKLIQQGIKNERLNEIKAISDSKSRKIAEKDYRMGIKHVVNCLEDNRNFTDCFLFQKIEQDIQAAFQLE
jgi:Protein of unknown function (DUF4435)